MSLDRAPARSDVESRDPRSYREHLFGSEAGAPSACCPGRDDPTAATPEIPAWPIALCLRRHPSRPGSTRPRGTCIPLRSGERPKLSGCRVFSPAMPPQLRRSSDRRSRCHPACHLDDPTSQHEQPSAAQGHCDEHVVMPQRNLRTPPGRERALATILDLGCRADQPNHLSSRCSFWRLAGSRCQTCAASQRTDRYPLASLRMGESAGPLALVRDFVTRNKGRGCLAFWWV